MMLEIRDLHAGYSGNEVLHGVSLDVAEGEMVAIIGPNGAGKSTLLNCISGPVADDGRQHQAGRAGHHRRGRLPDLAQRFAAGT